MNLTRGPQLLLFMVVVSASYDAHHTSRHPYADICVDINAVVVFVSHNTDDITGLVPTSDYGEEARFHFFLILSLNFRR